MRARSRAPSSGRASGSSITTTHALARNRRPRRARARRRDPSGHPDLPGVADFHQSTSLAELARRPRLPPSAYSSPPDGSSSSPSIRSRIASSKTSSRERSRAPAASRHQPQPASAPPTFRVLTRRPENAGRSRDRRQSARPLGKTPRRRTHRCCGAPGRRSRRSCRACPRSTTSCGGGRDPPHSQLVVICALVLAAAYVYRIKFDSTVQAERLAKIRSEVRRERDHIAALARRMGRAGQSRTHRRAGQALPAAQADRADAVRHSSINCPTVRRNSYSPTAPIRSARMIEKLEGADGTTGSVAPEAVAPQDATPADGAGDVERRRQIRAVDR